MIVNIRDEVIDTITERETFELAIERCEIAIDDGDLITARHALSWLLENARMAGWLADLRDRVISAELKKDGMQ